MLERWRVGDPDHAPRRSSFWYLELGGELEYGFSLPDPDAIDKSDEIRNSERFIKLELMLAEGVPMKDIATEFGVHKSTITRMKQRLQEEARAAEAAAARDPNGPVNSWNVKALRPIATPVNAWKTGQQLGKRLQLLRRNGGEEAEEEQEGS